MHHTSLLRVAFATALAAVLVLFTGACNSQSGDVLGLAYVAPASVNLRSELSQKNATVAVLTHGQRVQILDVRRRFVRVRTGKGIEGWMDSSQLLTPEQMEQIRRDTEHALSLPSEGSATVFEALNIHLEPSRQSPAFARIPETASVDVLAHKLSPKVTGPVRAPIFTVERPQSPARRERKDKKAKAGFKLPPRPAPPKAPENWLELSTGKVAAQPAEVPKKQPGKTPEEPKKPVVMEDWTLVRTKDKQAGWVLSRNLIMSIPDEVAQYAEGKHITSYFDLGAVTDEEKGVKHNWLWTTLSEPASYDFDAWRVFLWNRKRHRFETSYREHGLEGYFPVHVDSPDSNALGQTFQIITKEEDGKFWRHDYIFDGVRVHLTGKEEIHRGAAVVGNAPGPGELHVKAPRHGWFSRHWESLKKRLTGHVKP